LPAQVEALIAATGIGAAAPAPDVAPASAATPALAAARCKGRATPTASATSGSSSFSEQERIGSSSFSEQERIGSSSANGGDGDDELLVDEDGSLFDEGSPLADVELEGGEGDFDDDHDGDDVADDKHNNGVAAESGPASWEANKKVLCSAPSIGYEKQVRFLRLGNDADWANKGRARISYERVKKSCKFKYETITTWVLPETLKLPPQSPQSPPHLAATQSSVSPPSRKSARRAEETALQGSIEGNIPESAAIHRKRKRIMKKDAPVFGHGSMELKTQESQIPPAERVKQYPGQSLCVDPLNPDGLRCNACGKSVFNKASSITSHCKLETRPGDPTKHAENLQKWNARSTNDQELKHDLVEYFRVHADESPGTRDPNELLYRYRTAEAFVLVPPFSAMDKLRPYLSRAGFALTASTNLKIFVPQIEERELQLVSKEYSDQYIGVAFDGTTRLGEAINVTGRWCTKAFHLMKRLLDFHTLKKHVDNVALAAHITNLLMTKRSIPLLSIVNIARDSVKVNGAACRRLRVSFSSAADTLCVCHTLCHVGEHFALLTLTEFKTPWLELAGGRHPHKGAQALWKEMVAVNVPGYSAVRWYAWAEIIFVIANAGMKVLGEFITTCEERDYGDATRKSLRRIYDNKQSALQLELAAMLDMQILVSTTYELEGDRLEILLTFERVEALRELGRFITARADGILPNVDAVLRQQMVLKKGIKLEKHFHGAGKCVGTLDKLEEVESSLYPGQERHAWLCKYDDGHEEHFEEEELRSGKEGPTPAGQDGKPILIVRHLSERQSICDALAPGFQYLENRLAGPPHCDASYSLVEMHELCRMVRAFDPSFAVSHLDPAFVDGMVAITPLMAHGLLPILKQQLPQYLAAAAQSPPTLNRASVDEYTSSILLWWRTNGGSFPAWAMAARMTFAISPNSASCERIFALVKQLFGDEQLSSLADYIFASLMLNYHGRGEDM
jgi:hypothetical protein